LLVEAGGRNVENWIFRTFGRIQHPTHMEFPYRVGVRRNSDALASTVTSMRAGNRSSSRKGATKSCGERSCLGITKTGQTSQRAKIRFRDIGIAVCTVSTIAMVRRISVFSTNARCPNRSNEGIFSTVSNDVGVPTHPSIPQRLATFLARAHSQVTQPFGWVGLLALAYLSSFLSDPFSSRALNLLPADVTSIPFCCCCDRHARIQEHHPPR
jgi:hypothetical protein